MKHCSRDRDVSIIIREAGERTLALCRTLAEAEVGADRVALVSEVPFEKALRRTFELGSEMDTPWVLVVDADVLLRDGAVQELMHIAHQLDPNVFEVQGRVLDKLCGGFREAGIHLYRTALLRKGIEFIPEEGKVERPEKMTIEGMRLTGFSYLKIPHIIMGLHDHEQYLRDVWRKAFFQAKKHAYWTPYIRPLWQRLAHSEPDFCTALLGMDAGQNTTDSGKADIRIFDAEKINRQLLEHGLVEKASLPADAMTLQEVDRRINEFEPPPEYWNFRAYSHESLPPRGAFFSTRLFVSERGFLRLPIWLLGVILNRMGQRLKDVVS